MPDLSNALVVEWKQIPSAMFQHLEESIPQTMIPLGLLSQFHINDSVLQHPNILVTIA